MPDQNVILVRSVDMSFMKDMSVEGLLRRMRPPAPQPKHAADLSEFSDEELQSELSKRRAARARELSEKRRDHFERFCLLCRHYHGMLLGCYWGANAQDVTVCSLFDDRNDERWTRIYRDEYESSKLK